MIKNSKYLFLIVVIFIIAISVSWFSSFTKLLIMVDNKAIQYWTKADTVEETIRELKLVINQRDSISPPLSAELKEFKGTGGDLIIKIVRIKEENVILKENIPYEKEYINDNSFSTGQNKVVKKGKEGINSKTYLVTYHDSIETNRELIKNDVVVEPLPEVIAVGTRKIVQRAGKNLDIARTLVMKATAYSHTGNKTYTGVWPQKGSVAVDPKVIPLGSKLYIDSYGFAVAQDVGSAIKGDRIDLFMNSQSEALRWGRRTVRVYILN